MKSRFTIMGIVLVLTLVVNGCGEITPEPEAGLPNPASVYCEGQGYTLEIRTDESGAQYGVCILPDGSECEEWAFYRGECGPATPTASQPEPTPTLANPSPTPENPYPGWASYADAEYGFTFYYPPTWSLEKVPVSQDPRGTWARGVALRQGMFRLLIHYQRSTEEFLMGPGGLPAGDLEERGTVTVMGQPVVKQVLTYEGKDKLVMVGAEVGDIKFTMLLSDDPSVGANYELIDIPPEVQAEVDRIIESFQIEGESEIESERAE